MKDSYQYIEKLLNNSKTVDSATLVVDDTFKDNLRGKIMEKYIESKPNRLSIFTWFQFLSVSTRRALLVFLILITISLVVGGGIFISRLNNKEVHESPQVA